MGGVYFRELKLHFVHTRHSKCSTVDTVQTWHTEDSDIIDTKCNINKCNIIVSALEFAAQKSVQSILKLVPFFVRTIMKQDVS